MLLFFGFIVLVAFCLLFLLYPVLDPSHADQGKAKEQEDGTGIIQTKIERIKSSLKDIELENKIGKMSDEDAQIFRSELLREWSAQEKKLKSNKARKKAVSTRGPA